MIVLFFNCTVSASHSGIIGQPVLTLCNALSMSRLNKKERLKRHG